MGNWLNIVNRESYPTFQASPMVQYMTSVNINRTYLKMINHEKKYKALKEAGLNIDISNPEIYVNGNKKPPDGIFSPMFGADTTVDTPIYSCDCHELTGGANRGKLCPKCNSVCRTIDADLRLCGYINIAPYHILTYHGYNAFAYSKIFKDMEAVITSVKKINTKGKIVADDIPTLMELYDDYNDKYKQIIGLPRGVVFTSKIPVYSARLRPLIRQGTKMTMFEVNKFYLSIVKARNILKTAPLIGTFRHDIEVQKTLNQIQSDFLGVCNFVQERLNGKKGAFRGSLASGRVDNSSRMVITLGTDLKACEVDVPYQTMMVIYEEEIASFLSKLEGIPVSKAISIVAENQVYRNEKFVKIINQLLKTGNGVWVLINRNPTISESGILYTRIRKIHDDSTDMTMHLPPDILGCLAADLTLKVYRVPSESI